MQNKMSKLVCYCATYRISVPSALAQLGLNVGAWNEFGGDVPEQSFSYILPPKATSMLATQCMSLLLFIYSEWQNKIHAVPMSEQKMEVAM